MPNTYLCLILIVCLFWMGIWDDFKISDNDVVYYYSLSRTTLFNRISLSIVASITAVLFCDEWESKSIWMYGTRVGVKGYVNKRIVSIVLSTIFVIVSAHLFFIISLSLNRSWYTPVHDDYRLVCYPLRAFIQAGDIWKYYVFDILSNILKFSTFSVIAFVASIWSANKFVSISTPVIVWYFSSYLMSFLHCPEGLILSNIFDGNCSISNPYLWVLYLCVVSIGMIVVMSCLGYTLLKKRID